MKTPYEIANAIVLKRKHTTCYYLINGRGIVYHTLSSAKKAALNLNSNPVNQLRALFIRRIKTEEQVVWIAK